MASIDELLVYCVYRILERGEDCTFERLVAECFTLYPKEFGLRGYEHWPDSARVNKAWLRCRTDRGWITGSVKDGFHLTEQGRQVALKVQQSGKIDSKRGMDPGSTRSHAMVLRIRKSPAFQRYRRDPKTFRVSEMEFRSMLKATMETPPRVLRETINAYKNAAEDVKDEEVIDFLTRCIQNMAQVLNPSRWGSR